MAMVWYGASHIIQEKTNYLSLKKGDSPFLVLW
jgi:hypothetical protein